MQRLKIITFSEGQNAGPHNSSRKSPGQTDCQRGKRRNAALHPTKPVCKKNGTIEERRFIVKKLRKKNSQNGNGNEIQNRLEHKGSMWRCKKLPSQLQLQLQSDVPIQNICWGCIDLVMYRSGWKFYLTEPIGKEIRKGSETKIQEKNSRESRSKCGDVLAM